MGDRANVVIVQHGGNKKDDGKPEMLYLYTHWSGSELRKTVQEVLKRKERWDDEPYLARMIFSAMIADDVQGATGYGLSTYLCDNGHPLIVVDCQKGSIGLAKPGEEPECYQKWTFQEFCNLKEKERDGDSTSN